MQCRSHRTATPERVASPRLSASIRYLRGLTLLAALLLALGSFAAPLQAAPRARPSGERLAQSASSPLTLSPLYLLQAQAGAAYSQLLVASGGVAPYSFSISSGALPDGITLSNDGLISGMTTLVNSFMVTVSVSDSAGQQINREYSLVVNTPIAVSPPALVNAKVGSAYAQSLDASGGVGPYTFEVIGGALPQGISLSAQGVVSGTPVQADYSAYFLVTATDSRGVRGFRDYYWAIDPALTITPPTLPIGKVGAAYSQSLGINGGTAPYSFVLSSGALPQGLQLSTAGLLSGTPTAAGYFAFAVQATDARGLSGQQSYSFQVDAPSLTIGPGSLPDSKIGVTYRQRLTVSGGTAPFTFALTDGALPQGLALSADGTLSGKPLVDGLFYFTVTASDARGVTGSAGYTLAVSRVLLTISPATLPNGTAGLAYRQRLTTSGGTGPYRFTLIDGSLPTGLSLSSDGWLRGRPLTAFYNNITIQVADGRGNLGTQWYRLVVDQALSFQPYYLPYGVAGKPYSQQLTASGGAAPYTFALAEGALPPGLTLSSAGLISGVSVSQDNHGFVVRATDARGLIGSYYYFLTMNTPIAISPPSLLNARAGSAYQQVFGASGGTAPYTLTINGLVPPGLTFESNGTLSGTPSSFGWYGFNVTATDSRGLSATNNYSLFVDQALQLAPTFLRAGLLGEPYAVELSAYGGRAPYRYQVSSGVLPAGLTLSADGLLQGTPMDLRGAYFTITATDDQGLTGQTDYYFSVYEPQIEIAPDTLPAAQMGLPYDAQLSASAGTGPYLFYSAEYTPPGLRITPAGQVRGTPTLAGEYRFFVQVVDARGVRASRIYTLVVEPITIETQSLPDAQVKIAYSQQLTASGGSGPYTFVVNSDLPPGLALSPSGVLSGTPRETGQWWLQLLAIDANGYTGMTYLPLWVIEPLAMVEASLPDGSVGAAYSAQLSASGGEQPYTFAVSEGTLPPGLELDASGAISGAPSFAGVYAFTITVSDLAGRTAQRQYIIPVN